MAGIATKVRAGPVDVTGAQTISSTLAVTGATTLASTLAVTGASTLTGNVSAGGTLAVTGASTLTGNVSCGGTLGVTGALTASAAATVGTTLGVTGATTLSAACTVGTTLGVTGATTLSSTLAVTGATTLASTLTMTGGSGATWVRGINTELLVLSTGGATTNTSANLLPANSIIKATAHRVTTTITTATNWSIGDSTTAARFAAANSTLTANTTSVGLAHMQGGISTDATGPVQVSATTVRVTTTGTPGAGAIRLVAFYEQFTAPTA